MEFREAVMKLMVHKPPPEQTIFQRDKNTAAVSPAKHKWKISLNRPSSSVSSKTTPVQHTQQHPPQQGQTPKEFLCPVFGSLMADPVIVSSGHTFERACVQACKTLGFSPTTADAIPPDFSNVIPNLALKSAILNWCSNRFLEPPKPLDSSSAEKLVRTLIDSQKPKPDTHRKKKDLKVSASEKELIQGIATNPSVRDNHASTEVTRRPTHFYSSSDESVKSTLPLQLATRPSCYSSSSSSEMETLNPNSKVEEEEEEEEEDFVTKLKSPQVCEIEDALTSLRKMTRTREESRARLCTPQLLSALRSLIISRYTVIEVNSVALLVNLSLEKSNKVKIVRSGIVPPLINVLKGGSPEAQEHASGALFSLALDDENKTAIGVLGALQPLLHLLRSESKRTRQDSALALYHLSLVQSNRSKLVKLGSVPVLINMLRSGHMRGRVLLILCNLASCWEGRTAVLDSGGVECLMRILRGENLEESARESCVAVLYGLSHVGLRFKGLAMAAGGAEVLRLRFRSVRIPRDNLLNRFGDVSRDGKYVSSLPTINKRFAATLGELVGGRVGLAYASVGVLKIAGTIAIRYSLLRQQFGPPKQPEVSILDYQSQQHKLMPMLASTYAFHFATKYLVEKYSEMKKTHDDQLVGDVHALSAGLKSYVTSYTAKSLSICREACGGHGYAAVNRFGTLRNDHDIFQTFEGDNTVLLQQVAADLLKQYKEKFQGGTLAVTWNYLRESMSAYLSQPNPVTARWEGEDHLRDPTFQLDAFRYRTSRLLQSVAVRLRKHSKTLGSFGAWNRCLNHLLTLAESHIESVILAKFIEAVQNCPDASAQAALKLVCDLYALDHIWNDIGTYRNVDYVAPNKAKAIHKLTEYLSFQVRNIARELVDGFDLPDHVTRAPIAMQSEAYAQYTQYVGF